MFSEIFTFDFINYWIFIIKNIFYFIFLKQIFNWIFLIFKKIMGLVG